MPPKRIGGGGPASASAMEVPGEISAKVCVVGDSNCGKSCLAARFTKDEFTPTQEPTIGAAFSSHRVQVKSENGGGGGENTTTVKLDIWDTAGQERFRSLTPMYFRGAVGGVVVYDISYGETFRRARTWIGDLRKTKDNIAVILLGNKCDLPDEKRQVSREEGEALADEEGILFFETSAKTGENVSMAFESLAGEIVRKGLAAPPKAAPGGAIVPGGAPGSKGGVGAGGGNEKKCPC